MVALLHLSSCRGNVTPGCGAMGKDKFVGKLALILGQEQELQYTDTRLLAAFPLHGTFSSAPRFSLSRLRVENVTSLTEEVVMI